MSIKVKAEHAHRVFGFNNSGKPLGERDDCHLLYADAKYHNITHILEMFEEVDIDTELLERGEQFIKRRKPPVNKNGNGGKRKKDSREVTER